MSWVEQSRRIWQIDDPLFEAGGMADPYLPLTGGCRDLNSTWIDLGRLNFTSTETARPPLNLDHFISPCSSWPIQYLLRNWLLS